MTTAAGILSEDERQRLLAAALAARGNAYAPYSKFAVGAALLTAANDFICGANVENASYGLTTCAERVALQAAVAGGQRKFRALAIATLGGASPCGACRQVLAEFCDDLPIFLIDAGQANEVREVRLADLLPDCFRLLDG